MQCKLGWLHDFVHSCRRFAVLSDALSQVRWLRTGSWHWCVWKECVPCPSTWLTGTVWEMVAQLAVSEQRV